MPEAFRFKVRRRELLRGRDDGRGVHAGSGLKKIMPEARAAGDGRADEKNLK